MGDVVFMARGSGRYSAYIDGEAIAWARVNEKYNYIGFLVVRRENHRQGIATELVRFIGRDRGRKLNRCPSRLKNSLIKALSEKLGDELLEEAIIDDDCGR